MSSQIEGIYILKIVSFIRNIAPINVHFISDHNSTMRVDLWNVNVRFYAFPGFSHHVVNVNIAVADPCSDLSSKKYYSLLVSDTSMTL